MKTTLAILMAFTLVSCVNMQNAVSSEDGIYADDPSVNEVADNRQNENEFTKALQNLEQRDKIKRVANSQNSYKTDRNSNRTPYNITGVRPGNRIISTPNNDIYIVGGYPNFGFYDPFWSDFYPAFGYYNNWNYGYGRWRGFGFYGPSFYDPYLPYYQDINPYVQYGNRIYNNNYRRQKRPFASNTFRKRDANRSVRNYNRNNSSIYRRNSTYRTRNYTNRMQNNTRRTTNNYPRSSRKPYVRSNVKVKRR